MTPHPNEMYLQRHVDGDLPAAERWGIEAHLRECGDCAGRYAALKALVGGVAELPGAIEPPVDLWPGIAQRIAANDRVTPLPFRPAAIHRGPRVPVAVRWGIGLAAALAMGIGLGRTLPRPSIPLATAPVAAPTVTSMSAEAILASYDDPVYDRAVNDLRLIVESMRGRLQPETMAILEENLAIIDAAIAESRAALLVDPASDHLHRHLAASMQAKLDLLRMVARAVAAEI